VLFSLVVAFSLVSFIIQAYKFAANRKRDFPFANDFTDCLFLWIFISCCIALGFAFFATSFSYKKNIRVLWAVAMCLYAFSLPYRFDLFVIDKVAYILRKIYSIFTICARDRDQNQIEAVVYEEANIIFEDILNNQLPEN
jgi:hypothetical protein